MKCTDCSYDNLPKSQYCQECGKPMRSSHKDDKTLEHSFREEIEKVDDIIFRPKKRGASVGGLFKAFFVIAGLGFVGLLFLVFLISVFSSDDVATDTTSVDTELTSFPISYLQIQDLDAEWVGEQFYIKGILRNDYSVGAKDVHVRVDFYKDKNEEQLFDTRYVTIVGVSANGAYRFNEPVYIDPYNGYFWYVTRIEGAEYLE